MSTQTSSPARHGRLDDAMQNMLELVTPSTSPQVIESFVRAIKVHFEQLPGRTLTPVKLSRMFSIDVDVAVRDTDAWIYRIGYNITLLGKMVFINASPQ